MADSDKNILITPNRSQTAQPSIAFTGKGNIPITLRVLDDSTGTLSFEGSAGQLFSINNNLASGTIFSVNDVSGIPMIDVDASGLVRLAPLGGTVYSNTLYAVPRTVAGSGNSVTVRAADGLTSGAGGNILLLPGLQATTGGDGKIIVRQPGGTAGTNEVQMWHDGSQFHIKNFTAVADYGTSSSIILKSSNDFGVQIGRVGPSTVGVYPVGTSTIAIGNPSSQTVYAGWWYSNFYSGAWEPSNSTYPINWTDVGFYRGSVRQLVVGNYSSGGGSLCYTSSTPSALSTNPTNDLALSGSAFQRLSSSSALAVTGIAPPSGGAHVDGRVMWLHNVGSFNITLKHSQTSTAANQFINEGGGDIVLGPNRIVQCTYDSTSTKWRVNGEMYPYNFPTTDGTNGQVLTTNGSGTLSWATSSGGVSGSGTTNYVTKFTGTSAVGNSQIFDNGTNVGIGTASPSAKLHVVADSALTNPESDIGVYSLFLNSNATTNAGSAIGLGANGTAGAIIVGQRVGANNESVMKLQTRDSAGTAATRVTISSGGNVGIGTTSPSYRLDVAGTIKSAGTGYNTATSPSIYLTNTTATTGRTFIINSANNGAFQVADANASDATRLYLLANGNFGIGNNSSDPGAQLQVTALAAGTKGLIVKGAASQSANLQEWQDSAGNVPISVSSAGTLSIAKSGTRPSYIVLNNTVATESVEVTMQQNGVQRAAFGICGTTNAYILNPPSASDFGFRADNVNILFSMNAGSSVQAMLTSGGRFGVGTSATADVTGMIQANPTSASTKGLVVKAAASQTANLLEIQNSSGTNLVYVDSTGDLAVGVPSTTYFPSGPAAPLHVTRPTTAVATAVAAWPTYEPDTQTHARLTALFTDGGNGGTATAGTGTTNLIQFGEYYTGRVVLMPWGAGGQTPSDQGAGNGRDIMLLGGKSDNTTGKIGGRVFIQGGTGFNASGWGANFGNVVLQPNGGDVGIGTSSPATKLHVVGAIRSSGYTGGGDGTYLALTGDLPGYAANRYPTLRSDGSIYFSVSDRYAAYLYSVDNSFNIANTSTQWRVSLNPNGTSYFTGGALAVGATTAAGGGQVYIAPQASGTKGLVVRAAASQSVNLQEWQDSTGSARSWISSACKLNVLQAGDGAQGGLEESVANFGHKSFWSNGDAGLISVGFADIAGTYNSSSARWDMYFKTGNSGDPSARTERMRILGGNGNVGIGTKVPDKLLTIAGNAATPQITIYKSPDGSINSAQQIAVLGTGSSNSNSGTTGGNEYGLLQLMHNGTIRCQIYAGGNGWILDGMSFGTNSSPGAQVLVVPSAAATKGLIVRGAASQSANLQEWQNSGGTVLASVDASGVINATHSGSFTGTLTTTANAEQYTGSLTRQRYFTGSIPTVVGNYREIFYVQGNVATTVEIELHAINSTSRTLTKKYRYSTVWGIQNGVVAPNMVSDSQDNSSLGFELETLQFNTYQSMFRIKRTIGTDAGTFYCVIRSIGTANGITESTGTGTSALSGYLYGRDYLNPTISPAPNPYTSGAGVSLTILANNGSTSGAGGSIILQPGAQATTGGNGSIRFINPSNTAQYFYIAPSTSALDIGLVGISNDVNTGGINFNGTNIRGLGTVNTSALFAGSFYLSSTTLRSTFGASVQLGSSNGTSTDNINYIWMRQDGHIAWYGDIGLRRDGVGVLSVTNGSTGISGHGLVKS